MLTADGKPRADLWVEDGIHPNHAGYLLRVNIMRPIKSASPTTRPSEPPGCAPGASQLLDRVGLARRCAGYSRGRRPRFRLTALYASHSSHPSYPSFVAARPPFGLPKNCAAPAPLPTALGDCPAGHPPTLHPCRRPAQICVPPMRCLILNRALPQMRALPRGPAGRTFVHQGRDGQKLENLPRRSDRRCGATLEGGHEPPRHGGAISTNPVTGCKARQGQDLFSDFFGPTTRSAIFSVPALVRHWSLSLVIGHWSLVIGHWSLVIGHWSLVIEAMVGLSTNIACPCPPHPLPTPSLPPSSIFPLLFLAPLPRAS